MTAEARHDPSPAQGGARPAPDREGARSPRRSSHCPGAPVPYQPQAQVPLWLDQPGAAASPGCSRPSAGVSPALSDSPGRQVHTGEARGAQGLRRGGARPQGVLEPDDGRWLYAAWPGQALASDLRASGPGCSHHSGTLRDRASRQAASEAGALLFPGGRPLCWPCCLEESLGATWPCSHVTPLPADFCTDPAVPGAPALGLRAVLPGPGRRDPAGPCTALLPALQEVLALGRGRLHAAHPAPARALWGCLSHPPQPPLCSGSSSPAFQARLTAERPPRGPRCQAHAV